MHRIPYVLTLAAASVLGACGGGGPGIVSHVTLVEQLPLAADVALVVPAEKNDILGLVYDGPRAGLGDVRSVGALGGRLRDNPCAEFLVRDDQKVETHVADAWPVDDPIMALLGFEPYLGVSTHLFVLLDATVTSFTEPGDGYAACCAEEDCGSGLVSAVYEGNLNLHAAIQVQSASPPLVLLDRSGGSLGLGLHEGKSFHGVVAVELTSN